MLATALCIDRATSRQHNPYVFVTRHYCHVHVDFQDGDVDGTESGRSWNRCLSSVVARLTLATVSVAYKLYCCARTDCARLAAWLCSFSVDETCAVHRPCLNTSKSHTTRQCDRPLAHLLSSNALHRAVDQLPSIDPSPTLPYRFDTGLSRLLALFCITLRYSTRSTRRLDPAHCSTRHLTSLISAR